jgi:hypothetical protein
MTTAKTVGLTILGLVVVAALGVGAYLGGWWLKSDTTNRAAEVRQETFGRQNALVGAILDDIAEAQDPNIPAAQRVALVDIICDNAAVLTGSIQLPPSAETFVREECP